MTKLLDYYGETVQEHIACRILLGHGIQYMQDEFSEALEHSSIGEGEHDLEALMHWLGY